MERIWIYQSNRELTETEANRILEKLTAFTAQWRAHGKQLAAWAEVRYNFFIIITVNEAVAPPTGCSIDKSVHLLKELEQELNVDLFDRMQITYKDGNRVKVTSRAGFEQLINDGTIHEDTTVFNNLVQDRKDLETTWEIPLKDSWHAKVFAV